MIADRSSTREAVNHARQQPTPARQWDRRHAALLSLSVVTVVVVAYVLRAYRLGHSFDLFVDEITYFRLGQSVGRHLHIALYGAPFFLHGPAYFFVEAGFLKLTNPQGHLIHQIYVVRHLNVWFAGVSAAALFLISYRVAGWVPAFVTALAFALDPFIITMNSQNLLDTSGVCWVLLGYACLLAGVYGAPLGVSWWRVVAAGLFFGLALLTKEMTAFLTLLPLGVCILLGWSLRRRTALAIATITCLTYLPYPVIAARAGLWDAFVHEKTHGVARLAGIIQETGFHRSGSPSLVHTIVVRLTQFGTTYTIIALGVVGAFVLWRSREPASRLVVAWVVSAYGLLAYCVAIGTLEEQFFYMLVVPALVATVCGIVVLLRFPGIAPFMRAGIASGALALSIVFIAWSGFRWIAVHTTPNNGYQTLLRYVGHEIPPRDRHVAAFDQTAQFLLARDGTGPWGPWHDVAGLRAYHPAYVVVTPHEIQWDYGAAALPTLHWIHQHGKQVFAFYGHEGNNIFLYRMSYSTPITLSVPVGQHPHRGIYGSD